MVSRSTYLETIIHPSDTPCEPVSEFQHEIGKKDRRFIQRWSSELQHLDCGFRPVNVSRYGDRVCTQPTFTIRVIKMTTSGRLQAFGCVGRRSTRSNPTCSYRLSSPGWDASSAHRGMPFRCKDIEPQHLGTRDEVVSVMLNQDVAKLYSYWSSIWLGINHRQSGIPVTIWHHVESCWAIYIARSIKSLPSIKDSHR